MNLWTSEWTSVEFWSVMGYALHLNDIISSRFIKSCSDSLNNSLIPQFWFLRWDDAAARLHHWITSWPMWDACLYSSAKQEPLSTTISQAYQDQPRSSQSIYWQTQRYLWGIFILWWRSFGLRLRIQVSICSSCSVYERINSVTI